MNRRSRSDPCASMPLVEARRDGRLSPRDEASLARHLASCAACSALERDLDRIGAIVRESERDGDRPSQLEHQRARARLLRAAAAVEPEATSAKRRAGVAVAIIAASAVAASAAFALRPSTRATLALHAPRVRVVTMVQPADGTRFTRTSEAGVDTIVLDDGAVDVSARPLGPSERLFVRTSDAEVEVRGTVFHVEATGRELRRVSVTEGKVHVTFRGVSFFVQAGEAWQAPASERTASADAANAPAESPPEPSPIRGEPQSSRRPRVSASASAAPTSSHPDSADATSQSFADALRSIEQGDYGRAADQLDTFRTANASDARAEDAAFLKIVALRRAGRKAEAAEAARAYLAQYPNGHRRAEALAVANER